MKQISKSRQQNASASQKFPAINTSAALQTIQLNEGNRVQHQNNYAERVTTIESHQVVATLLHDLYVTTDGALDRPYISQTALDTYKE